MIRMINLWNINMWLVGKCLEGYEGDDWRKRPEGASPAVWILGHILTTRKFLERVLGTGVPHEDWEERFAMGSDPAELPPDTDGGDLLRDFQETHRRFIKHLEGLAASDLEVEVEEEFPESPKTRLGALQFLFLHESYHVGQLGVTRVQLGKGSWMS